MEITDLKNAIKSCQDIGTLRKLRDDLSDVLIEMMPFLINAEPGIRKRTKLKRSFMEIVADRHGI